MKLFRTFMLLASVLMLAACASNSAATTSAPTPTPVAFQPTLGRALSFLARRYDPGVGLLRETAAAPSAKHWLAPDNLLALRVFRVANANDLATKVDASLAQYDATTNGLLETLSGKVVTWPPQSRVESEAGAGVWQASYTGDSAIEDWQQDSDLLFYGALNSWNQGRRDEAKELYQAAMATFDGTGFKDKSFDGQYATDTLALALYTGDVVGEPVNKAMLDALLGMQGVDGGFAAHYTTDGGAGDANSETTALALLALYKLR